MPEQYRSDIETAVDILKKDGCFDIDLFGDMVSDKVKEKISIDLVVRGLTKEQMEATHHKIKETVKMEVNLFEWDNNATVLIKLWQAPIKL